MSVTDLVNAAPATDAPRAVHGPLASLVASTGAGTVARTLHTNARVRDVCAPFSRAHWLSCEVVFVPRPVLTGHVLHITAAFTTDDAAPSAAASLGQEPTCSFYTGGSSDTCPSPFVFSLNFADAGTSTLVKPAPVEMHRTAVVFNIEIRDAPSGELIEAAFDTAAVDVYLRGRLQLGGKA